MIGQKSMPFRFYLTLFSIVFLLQASLVRAEDHLYELRPTFDRNATDIGLNTIHVLIERVELTPSEPTVEDDFTIHCYVTDNSAVEWVKINFCTDMCTIPTKMGYTEGRYQYTVRGNTFPAGPVEIHIQVKDRTNQTVWHNQSITLTAQNNDLSPQPRPGPESPGFGTVVGIAALTVILLLVRGRSIRKK